MVPTTQSLFQRLNHHEKHVLDIIHGEKQRERTVAIVGQFVL